VSGSASWLLVDIGNSQIKWLQVHGSEVGTWGSQKSCARSGDALMASLTSAGVLPQELVISSVADEDFNAKLAATFSTRGWPTPQFAASQSQQFGLTNSYSDPTRMGVDRWLAMLAAWCKTHNALIVVDAGTAVTIDVVGVNGMHMGGYILPGVGLMEAALTRDTQRVRFSDSAERSLLPGQSTAQCVTSGVWLAAHSAVQAVLSRYPDYPVFITGGDGWALMQMDIVAQWCPHLVLEGLFIHTQSHLKG